MIEVLVTSVVEYPFSMDHFPRLGEAMMRPKENAPTALNTKHAQSENFNKITKQSWRYKLTTPTRRSYRPVLGPGAT